MALPGIAAWWLIVTEIGGALQIAAGLVPLALLGAGRFSVDGVVAKPANA